MMGLLIKQLLRMECDRCGRMSDGVAETADGAKQAALALGFVVSEWMHEGTCPRQTCFCGTCVSQLAEITAKAMQS